ncbi:protein CBFA2T3 [Hyposmocoma kahamanoa]|uniref:protein CBFA2T3 n=1 Tax=Hyposmocoma kahamanoa TaxID=1477025 RepID=UPI000E6D84B5|nr:protein CBFA2T3 [Hyposmocoma kahamanoa]
MEAKVKEEVPDKDYNQPTTTERRKSITTGKERRSPEQEESRSSPTPGPPSPQNGVNAAALSSTESLSPPLPEGSRSAPALQRLRKFLSALQHFASDVGADTGERVRQLIYNLVAGTINTEEFQTGVQESTNYPLRASVPGFLRALLPLAQRDLHARARRAKQTPLQYIRLHEHLILEATSDSGDIFAPQPPGEPQKRRASDPSSFYDVTQTNGTHEDYTPQPKRAPPSSLFMHASPFICPLPSNASLFDYGQYHGYHAPGENSFERRDGGISVRDVNSMNASFSESRALGGAGAGPLPMRSDDEWKNIHTMLNCILSMVEKTKRALAILQQRGTVCSGRDQKPTALLRTSPPATTTTLAKTLTRSTTPITNSQTTTTDNRLSLSTLNTAERLLNNQERITNSTERIALATLSSAQGLIGGIGGKK